MFLFAVFLTVICMEQSHTAPATNYFLDLNDLYQQDLEDIESADSLESLLLENLAYPGIYTDKDLDSDVLYPQSDLIWPSYIEEADLEDVLRDAELSALDLEPEEEDLAQYRSVVGLTGTDIDESELPWYAEAGEDPEDETEDASAWLQHLADDAHGGAKTSDEMELEELAHKDSIDALETGEGSDNDDNNLVIPSSLSGDLEAALGLFGDAKDKRSAEELETYWLAQAVPAISFRKPSGTGEDEAAKEDPASTKEASASSSTAGATTASSTASPMTATKVSQATKLPSLMTAEKRGMLEVPIFRPPAAAAYKNAPAASDRHDQSAVRRKRSVPAVHIRRSRVSGNLVSNQGMGHRSSASILAPTKNQARSI